mgnify:CR=1 FL=1
MPWAIRCDLVIVWDLPLHSSITRILNLTQYPFFAFPPITDAHRLMLFWRYSVFCWPRFWGKEILLSCTERRAGSRLITVLHILAWNSQQDSKEESGTLSHHARRLQSEVGTQFLLSLHSDRILIALCSLIVSYCNFSFTSLYFPLFVLWNFPPK